MQVEGDTNLEPAAPAEGTGQQPEATESTEGAVSSSSLLDALRGSLASGGEGEDGDDDGAPAAATPEGEGEASAAADARLRGPDGRFLPKDAADPNAAAQDPNAQAQQQPDPNAAKSADDPYREPEGLKPEARERFQALVTRAKDATTAAEQATAQLEQVRGVVESFQRMIVDTGADDAELVALFDFAKAVKAGNWQAIEPLLGHLTQQFRTATGRDPSGADPFAQHVDLAQAVQSGQMTADAARQVLQARQVLAQQQHQRQQHDVLQRTQQQFVQSTQRATQAVSTMVQQWSQTDLDWPKKQALMQAHAKRIGETMPPEHWQAALQMAYDAIGQTMTTMAPPRTAPGPGTPQPLRPSAANAGRREPASLQEAIAGAVGAT